MFFTMLHWESSELDRTALVLEIAHEAYVATDADGRVTAWNPAAERTFGWSREEILGCSLEETIISAADRTRFARGLPRHLETGEDRAIGSCQELEAVDRTGRRFPIEITISALWAAGGLSFHAFLYDLTERRAAADAQRLAEIVEHSADAIVGADHHRVITDWNPAAERLFGFSREEAIGQSVDLIVPCHLRQEASTMGEQAMREGPVVGHETERRHRDGSVVHVEITLTRLAAQGTRVATSATFRDIGQRVRAERELADHCTRLKAIAATERLADRATSAAPRPTVRPDQELADHLIEFVRMHLRMEVACMMELADETATLVSVTGDGERFGLHPGQVLPRAETVCERIIGGAAPALVTDARQEPAIADLPTVRDLGINCYICVPIRLPDGRPYGALCAASREPNLALGERDVDYLHVLSTVLADQALRARQLADQSRTRAELTAVEALLAALDARDHYTGEHSHAVVDLSRAVASALGLDEAQTEAVGQVALLHDLGKVGIPDAILQKPGKLTETEWELMREHPAIGARIVAAIEPLAHLACACRAEHERWDGLGYPDRLAGEEIPIAARVTLACDAYHAMMSDRPYRASIGHEAAVAQLSENAGSQFDPDVIAALLSVLEG